MLGVPVSIVRTSLAILAAGSIAALPACGQSDPLRKQFARDIKKQKDNELGQIGEAFVSSWTNSAGETVHATCMMYGNRERPGRTVIFPHGDGIASLQRGDLANPDWVKYCSNPAVDGSGIPILRKRIS